MMKVSMNTLESEMGFSSYNYILQTTYRFYWNILNMSLAVRNIQRKKEAATNENKLPTNPIKK